MIVLTINLKVYLQKLPVQRLNSSPLFAPISNI